MKYDVKEIKVLMYELCLNDMEEQIVEFSNGYISDVFSEIAGNNVSIYTSDLLNYLSNNINEVNDNISDIGFNGNILSHISDVWYNNNIEELYRNINDMLKYFTLDNIIGYMIEYNIKNISKEDLDNIIDENCSDNIDKIDTIVYNIECCFEEYILKKYEPTYTIEDLICNQRKVYELEDEPTLYTVNDEILYFYSEVYRNWLESDMVYNDVMKQKFVEYTGSIKYEN